jgi:hypothetical protein
MEYCSNMRWTKFILGTLGATLMSSALQAVPATQLKENYQSIIERNPFGLKPPAPPATNVTQNAKEKPKLEVFLTGITSVGYPRLPKQAYFYTRESGKKELITYYTLTEGTSKDGIEVLNIDPEKRKVRIKMDNSETLLSFETHGVPVAAAAGRPGGPNVPGVPGVPGVPVQGQPGMPQPGVPLPNAGQPNAAYDGNVPPVYNPNPQPATQPMNAGVTYNNANTAASGTGLRQIPSRRIRGGSGNMGGNGGMAPPPMNAIPDPQAGQPRDLAEDYVRMHLNRAAQEQQGIPMPPLPVIE